MPTRTVTARLGPEEQDACLRAYLGDERFSAVRRGDPYEVIYRIDEDLAHDGKCLSRKEQGSPFIYDDDFGISPPDMTRGPLADGRVVEHVFGSEYDEKSGRWRRYRQMRLRTPTRKDRVPAPTFAERSRLRRQQWDAKRGEVVETITALPKDVWVAGYVLSVHLLESDDWLRIPSRSINGRAIEEFGRSDHLSPLRKERIREALASRVGIAAEFVAYAAARGCVAVIKSLLYTIRLSVTGPPCALVALMEHAAVVHAAVTRSGGGTKDGQWDQDLKCDGLPTRFRDAPDVENDECPPDGERWLYMDGQHATIGIVPYLEALYLGGGAGAEGGLAGWAYEDDETETSWGRAHHLALAVVETGKDFYPRHRAFKKPDGGSRVKYYLIDNLVGHSLTEDLGDVPAPDRNHNHGTSSAAVAMSDVSRGQDWEVLRPYPYARTAAAGYAFGYWAEANVQDALVPLSHGRIDGFDVLTSSLSNNAGTCNVKGECLPDPGYSDDACASPDDARGLDDGSTALVHAFYFEGVAAVKSAGNMHTSSSFDCRHALVGVRSEVGSPGAAPTVVAVGALEYRTTPNGQQATMDVQSDSSGGWTADGRSYPSLVVPHAVCGVARHDPFDPEARYSKHSHTSAAAPLAAGALVAYKHWLLAHSGASVANTPGHLVVAFLNMADGSAREDRDDSGSQFMEVPYHAYGMGRLQMRLFEPQAMDGGWGAQTISFGLEEGEMHVNALTTVPDDVKRFCLTIWWPEMNTGKGESKARIEAVLVAADHVIWKASGSECALRFQYDCDQVRYQLKKIRGAVTLYINGVSIPMEARGLQRRMRDVYVHWYYETKRWKGEIVCHDKDQASCKDEEVPRSNHPRGPNEERDPPWPHEDKADWQCEAEDVPRSNHPRGPNEQRDPPWPHEDKTDWQCEAERRARGARGARGPRGKEDAPWRDEKGASGRPREVEAQAALGVDPVEKVCRKYDGVPPRVDSQTAPVPCGGNALPMAKQVVLRQDDTPSARGAWVDRELQGIGEWIGCMEAMRARGWSA